MYEEKNRAWVEFIYFDLLLILPDFCPQEEKEIWNSFWSFNALWKEHLLIVIESFYVGKFGQLHNTNTRWPPSTDTKCVFMDY